MASQTLTEYERRRLENIKRNDEMMASLKLHSRVKELSSVTKRPRIETKSYKTTPEKKPKSETPIVIRRSLRARGMPPDSSTSRGIDDDLVASPVKTPFSPTRPKLSRRKLGPLSMRDVYSGSSSDRKLIDTLIGMSENARLSCSIKKNFDGDEGSYNTTTGMSENVPLKCSIKREFDGDGGSYNTITGMSENVPLKCSIKREFDGDGDSYNTITGMSENVLSKCSIKKEFDGDGVSLDLGSLVLRPENIARVMPGRILNVRFFPSMDRLIIVSGNKFGNVGFWDVDCKEGEGDGIFLYRPHEAPISGILIPPFPLTKVFTSCYDGFIRLMDVEKESFNMVYSSDDAIFSLSQRPHDAKSLYFGEAQGRLNVWDERKGKSSSSWILHDQRINTIDFNSENTNLMVTSSTDGTACIWDLRSIDAYRPEPLKIIDHKRAVHSAYFSPSGSCLATTSIDDTVGLLSGVDFMDMTMIRHNNQTGRWISSFRAIWGWDDSCLFIGNMKRGVDVISSSHRKTIMTLESPNISAIPCRFAAHPYKVGTLAGATSGGQVYIWKSM